MIGFQTAMLVIYVSPKNQFATLCSSLNHFVRPWVTTGFSPGFLAAFLIRLQGIHAVIIRGSKKYLFRNPWVDYITLVKKQGHRTIC